MGRKKLIDSNVNPSSSCAFNFAQTNPRPSGTSVGGTSQPNRSAQPMTHFYSQTTIDSSSPIDGMSQETRANMFRQGYKHIAPNFSMSNPGPTPYTRGCNSQTYTNNNSNYQAPYYTVAYTYPIPEFSKFSAEDGKTTLEHVGQFILQCGEASANDTLKLRMCPLALSCTAFTWFTSLAPNSNFTWAALEQKLHDYFYSRDTELRFSHLTTIKQNHNELVTNYNKRFRDTRNQCFNLNIFDKDLADLAYSGLSQHLKEKLESHVFSDVKSYKGVWIVKAEPKSLEASLGVVISLGTDITSTWLRIVASHRMMRKPTCV
jgi:hypothetical protein